MVFRYAAVIGLIWSVVICVSMVWNIHREREQTLALAKREAFAVLNKDEAIRFWAVSHAAVYVPADDRTPPNPLLDHMPDRDITTPSGIALTMINHAYMLKQIMHDYAEQSGIKGRLTSLKPYSPENYPDAWEKEALESFERGSQEAYEYTSDEGTLYLRFMRPVIAKKPCLKCHGAQGYREGDIRGGIEVSLPMAPLKTNEIRNITDLAATHGLIWLLGAVGIGTGARRIMRSITERTQAMTALRQSEKKFLRIFNAINDAIFIHDITGRIIEVNDQCCQRLGYSREELLKLSLFDLVVPDHAQLIREKIGYLTNQERVLFEADRITKEGKRLSMEISARTIEIEGETAIASVERDITDRKRMELELLKVTQLESLGVLAGGIAHDFNNLLHGILGNISLAKLHLRPEDKAYRFLKQSESAYSLAMSLTNQLITFSRGGAPLKKTFLIGDLIRDSAQFTLSGSNIKCKFLIPDGCCPVEADEGQMRQVIQNIVINAKEAMPGGGIIQISVEETSVREKELPPLEEGAYVKISAKDHGPGIPKENLARIFDPYFSTKGMGTQKGLGLGLAICYSIVRSHAGHITVESDLGVGTTFHIYLPRSGKDVEPAPEGQKSPPANSGRILIMDDEQTVTDVAEGFLRLKGYEVVVARDGAAAIELYKEAKLAGRPFDLVILDLTIPGGMGGLDTMQSLHATDPFIKAVVSSGYSNDPVLRDYERYGFKGALIKPYTIETLRELIATIIKTEIR